MLIRAENLGFRGARGILGHAKGRLPITEALDQIS